MKTSQQQHIYTHIHTCVIQSVVFFSLLWLSWKQRILSVDVLHFHVNWEFWLVRRDLYSNVTNPLKMVTADVGEILGGRIHDRPWLHSYECLPGLPRRRKRSFTTTMPKQFFSHIVFVSIQSTSGKEYFFFMFLTLSWRNEEVSSC